MYIVNCTEYGICGKKKKKKKKEKKHPMNSVSYAP